MTPIKPQNRLDGSNRSAKNNPQMPATTQTPKMPWFLRIQEGINLQSLAHTVGLGLDFLYSAVLAAFVAPPDNQTQLLAHFFGVDEYRKVKRKSIFHLTWHNVEFEERSIDSPLLEDNPLLVSTLGSEAMKAR